MNYRCIYHLKVSMCIAVFQCGGNLWSIQEKTEKEWIPLNWRSINRQGMGQFVSDLCISLTHCRRSHRRHHRHRRLRQFWLAFWSCQSNFISLFNAFIELNNMRWDNLPIITFTCQFLIINFFFDCMYMRIFLIHSILVFQRIMAHAYSVARYLSSFENCYC